MKRIITLLFLLSAMLIAKGNHYNSNLTLRMQNSSLFTVVFDNVPYHQPVATFSMNDLNPGCHQISIYKIKRNGYYHSYPVRVYSGTIEIPEASIINAVIRPNYIDIVNVFPICPPPAPVVYAPCHQPANYVMSDQEYQDLRYIISKKSFDSSRLAIAKDAIRNRPMSSRQVAGLLDLLSFDSSRLELAKYAYRYVADPSAYYLTYDEFTFESSVSELIDYIDRNS